MKTEKSFILLGIILADLEMGVEIVIVIVSEMFGLIFAFCSFLLSFVCTQISRDF